MRARTSIRFEFHLTTRRFDFDLSVAAVDGGIQKQPTRAHAWVLWFWFYNVKRTKERGASKLKNIWKYVKNKIKYSKIKPAQFQIVAQR